MPGDATERVAVLVVHLAAHEPSAPVVALGGRDALLHVDDALAREHRRIEELVIVEPERREDLRREQLIEITAGRARERLARDDVAEIAVDGLAGRSLFRATT